MGRVLINGVPCPILGRVCMDQLIVDISAAGEVSVEQEVVLLGKQGEQEIPLSEVCSILKTGPSEIYALMTKRLPRIYMRNGKSVYGVSFQRNQFSLS